MPDAASAAQPPGLYAPAPPRTSRTLGSSQPSTSARHGGVAVAAAARGARPPPALLIDDPARAAKFMLAGGEAEGWSVCGGVGLEGERGGREGRAGSGIGGLTDG